MLDRLLVSCVAIVVDGGCDSACRAGMVRLVCSQQEQLGGPRAVLNNSTTTPFRNYYYVYNPNHNLEDTKQPTDTGEKATSTRQDHLQVCRAAAPFFKEPPKTSSTSSR
jgi:hypothetical protein